MSISDPNIQSNSSLGATEKVDKAHPPHPPSKWLSCLIVLFLTVAGLLFFECFRSSVFQLKPASTENLHSVDSASMRIGSLDAEATPVKLPYRWYSESTAAGLTRHFDVVISAQQRGDGQFLLISGYRQNITVSWRGRVLLDTAFPAVMTHLQFREPQMLRLGWPAVADSGDITLTLTVTNTIANDGFIGRLYIGNKQNTLGKLTWVVRNHQWILVFALGTLVSTMLLSFVMPLDWSHRFDHAIFLLPHFLLILLELAPLPAGASLFASKLYTVSLILSVYTWAYLGYQIMGMKLRPIQWALVPIIIGLLPPLWQSTPSLVVYWTALVSEPIAAMVGSFTIVTATSYAATTGISRSQAVLALLACLVAGSGFADVLSYRDPAYAEQIKTFPMVASQFAILRFALYAYELAERNHRLVSHRNQILAFSEQQRRQLEDTRSKLQRYERLRILNVLGASISHEIRNPLGTLSNSLLLLEKRKSNFESILPTVMPRMRRNVDRIEAIIQKLLQFARHPQVLEAKATDLRQWLPVLLVDDQLLCAAGASTLHFHDNTKDLPEVELDRNMIFQALVNLVQNAAYTNAESGGQDIDIEIDIYQWEVVINVRDYGTGLHIPFNPERPEPLISNKNQGIGLGLMIVSDIASLHGGGFELFNAHGDEKGAVARLHLPLPLPSTAGQATASKAKHSAVS